MIHEYSPVEEEVGDQRRPGKRGGGPWSEASGAGLRLSGCPYSLLVRREPDLIEQRPRPLSYSITLSIGAGI
jgi:hypothetical protein